jgi:hypothetical protein
LGCFDNGDKASIASIMPLLELPIARLLAGLKEAVDGMDIGSRRDVDGI